MDDDIQRRIATEQITAKVDGINTVIAEPGQPVPLAYDHLVPEDKAEAVDIARSSRSTSSRRAAAVALEQRGTEHAELELVSRDDELAARAVALDERERRLEASEQALTEAANAKVAELEASEQALTEAANAKVAELEASEERLAARQAELDEREIALDEAEKAAKAEAKKAAGELKKRTNELEKREAAAAAKEKSGGGGE